MISQKVEKEEREATTAQNKKRNTKSTRVTLQFVVSTQYCRDAHSSIHALVRLHVVLPK
jgi:hypothetical protein